MVLWFHSAQNDAESRLQIESLIQVLRNDDRFAWRPLPCAAGRGNYLVRTDNTCRGPVDNPCGSMLETETLPQFQWPAAAPFAEWIAENGALFRGKRVLELGSGTGVIGLVVSTFAELVVLTDCSLVSLAMMTLTMNEGTFDNCSVGLLRWGSEEAVDELKRALDLDAFDVVIGSDVFYFKTSLKAGLKTAKRALESTQPSSAGYFLCASVARSERMDEDLSSIPVTMGFNSTLVTGTDAFRLFKWTVQC